jgi:nuclear pore complex protein Nup93
LNALAEVLLGYGERHFDGAAGQKGGKRGVWAGVLLMCGQFERVSAFCFVVDLDMMFISVRAQAVAALWDHPETEVEAIHLAIALSYHGLLRVSSKADMSDMTACKFPFCMYTRRPSINNIHHPVSLPPGGPPSLNFTTMIWRYVRQFVKMDAKEALHYVYCVTLNGDAAQGPDVGRDQVETAWELVRRIIVLANAGAAWEELVGGFRPDGTRFVSVDAHSSSFCSFTNPAFICSLVSLNRVLLCSS